MRAGSLSTRARPRPRQPSGPRPRQVFRTVTLPALRPALVSAASVVFLFCATSFGVVLTLGGLRYSSVETEIYLLTTQLLDLPAAAALSIVQLRRGHGAAGARRPAARHTGCRAQPAGGPTAPSQPGRRPAARGHRGAAGPRGGAPGRARGRQPAGRRRLGTRELPRTVRTPSPVRRCSSRSPTPWSPRCGPPSTRPGWPCSSAVWWPWSSRGARGRGPSVACVASWTASSCCRWASRR